MDNCSCGIPDNAVVLNTLNIVEYLDPEDGDIYKVDLSCGSDGDDLPTGKYYELAEWARMIASAPFIAEMVHDYIFEGDDGDDDENAEV